MNFALPSHYAEVFAAALTVKPGKHRECYSPRVYLYAQPPPRHRRDLAGKVYLEAFEKVHGGVVFLNWWAPATPAGVREFFSGLAERSDADVSPRPYRLGQACDGTINSPVLFALKVACAALGLEPDRLYKKAYPERGDNPPIWSDCRRHAEWQGGVELPTSWDDAAIGGLIESLHEINFHSLAAEVSDAAEAALREGATSAERAAS